MRVCADDVCLFLLMIYRFTHTHTQTELACVSALCNLSVINHYKANAFKLFAEHSQNTRWCDYCCRCHCACGHVVVVVGVPGCCYAINETNKTEKMED